MRTLTPAAAAALASGELGMILLLQILTTPPVQLNSTNSTLTYAGDTYLAGGLLGSVEPVEDTLGEPQGMRFQLNALPADVMALALSDDVKGARCTLCVAILDKATGVILDAPQVFAGEIDQMPISLDTEGAVISVTAVSRAEAFGRPKPLRNTDADQQRLAPGDTSRRFVISQSQTQDVWPAAAYFRQ